MASLIRKYDPSDFIVPPQMGKNGFSERIQCRIQSGHHRAIGILATSGLFPFKQASDVIRWCIKEGLAKLEKIEPGTINSVYQQAEVAIAIARDEVYRQQFLELFNSMATAVGHHIATQNRGQAVALVNKVRQQIGHMPDEPQDQLDWKLKYLKELEERFGYLDK